MSVAVVRHYTMTARPGEAEALRRVLLALRTAVRRCPGSLRVDLLHVADAPHRLIFIEHWDRPEDRSDAGRRLPAPLMASLKALLATPPEVVDLVEAGLPEA